jgi:hypothetical protein
LVKLQTSSLLLKDEKKLLLAEMLTTHTTLTLSEAKDEVHSEGE